MARLGILLFLLICNGSVAGAVECSLEQASSAVKAGVIKRIDALAGQSIKAKQAQRSIEFGLKRDVEFIAGTFAYVEATYAGTATIPDRSSEDFLPAAVLASSRETAADQKWPLTQPNNMQECSVEVALHQLEQARYSRIDTPRIQAATKRVTEIATRNKDMSQASASDRAIVKRLMRDVIEPSLREQTFIRDVETLKGLWRAAIFKYQTGKEALASSGDDLDAVDAPLNEKLKAGGQDAVYLATSIMIAEHVPSEH